MSLITTFLFIIVVSNAGGEGKTLTAQLIKALLELAGEPVVMLDGDAGNQAAKVADSNAKVVGWGVEAIRARDIVAATSGSHVILDLGANSLASAREIVDLLPALRDVYAEESYRTVALLPVSTNKLGAVGAIQALAPKIDGFEKLFVKVDRDGSGVFDGTLEGSDVIKCGHLMPGLQAVIRQPGQTMAKAVTDPAAGFHLAAVQIAEWMRKFAVEPRVVDLLGAVPAVLNQHARPVDVPGYSLKTIKDCTDTALADNFFRTRIIKAIFDAGYTPAGLREVARRLESGSL